MMPETYFQRNCGKILTTGKARRGYSGVYSGLLSPFSEFETLQNKMGGKMDNLKKKT